ncbi:hypothetical protein [Streptosporangium sp. NPDC000396]|uniref:hypothetical protein n=1 Tax=Streptosporangium sp. NPDC000396 TaxID=3366185 RepID=UPI0036C988EF
MATPELGRINPDASAEATATMIVGACHELILPFTDSQCVSVRIGELPPAAPRGLVGQLAAHLGHGGVGDRAGQLAGGLGGADHAQPGQGA